MFDFIKKSISSIKETLSSKVSTTTKVKKLIFKEIKLNEEDIDKILWDFEISLLESDVPLEIVENLKNDFKKILENHTFKEENIDIEIKNLFKKFLYHIFDQLDNVSIDNINQKPYIVLFLGPNGNGKTTTIAKIGYYIKNKLNKNVIFSASDTFRAGAIEQLEEHGRKLGIKVIKHKYGADPTAVAYDAVAHAKSKNIDYVLIDTSGRQETNENLIREIEKMIKKINPDLKVLVLEATVGNNSFEKLKEFGKYADCVIITKYDLDTKGGILLACAYYKKPILFLGTGQSYEDLIPFDKEKVIQRMID